MKIKQPSSLHCFVCGVESPVGLHMHFYESSPGEVTAEFTPSEGYQGYPGILHGGITAAILDEAAGRAYMGIDNAGSNFMYTAELKVKYRRKVPIGQPLKIVGRRVKRMRWTAESHASIYDSDGNLLAEASAILVDVPEQFHPNDLEQLGWKVYPDTTP